MAHILIIRFSALGDVAMTVPVVHDLARQYPDDRITVLTRKGWEPLFGQLPPNASVRGVRLTDYKGIWGLIRLHRELRAERPTHVADLHDVLRSKFLRLRFLMDGCRVAHIDKGRQEKKRMVRRQEPPRHPLRHSIERYADALARLDRKLTPEFRSIFPSPPVLPSALHALTGEKGGDQWLGVAPFARHKGKIYPEEQMREVLRMLDKDGRRIFLFGGGEKEKQICEDWAGECKNVVSLVGRTCLSDELKLIALLDGMLSMDSANMHLAAVVCGTPVVSVWGATHPFAGFSAWNQPADRAVQLPLPCRPCSVYGNTPCHRGDYACLTRLQPSVVAERVERLLNSTSEQ